MGKSLREIYNLYEIVCTDEQTFGEWLNFNRQVHQRPSKYAFCSDCTIAFAAERFGQGRCNGWHYFYHFLTKEEERRKRLREISERRKASKQT